MKRNFRVNQEEAQKQTNERIVCFFFWILSGNSILGSLPLGLLLKLAAAMDEVHERVSSGCCFLTVFKAFSLSSTFFVSSYPIHAVVLPWLKHLEHGLFPSHSTLSFCEMNEAQRDGLSYLTIAKASKLKKLNHSYITPKASVFFALSFRHFESCSGKVCGCCAN